MKEKVSLLLSEKEGGILNIDLFSTYRKIGAFLCSGRENDSQKLEKGGKGMINVTKSVGSTFSRTASNVEKMGAYYTDRQHCKDLAKLFVFPKDEPVTALEPSIGDGFAVTAVTDASHNENVHIFGVELNAQVAEETRENPYVEQVLSGDFLTDVRISGKVFSFVFGNPPYLTEKEEEENLTSMDNRLEWKFLEKVTNLMMTGGILVWVIPHRIFTDSFYFGRYLNRFELLKVYKFRKSEYEKFKQVVIIGRRLAGTKGLMRSKKEELLADMELEKLKELPEDFKESEKILVPASAPEQLKTFCLKEFDTEEAGRILDSSSFMDVRKVIGKELKQETFNTVDMGQPVIPLKKDSLYLCATAGAGMGLVGSEGDLHLQRGNVEMVETVEYEKDPTNPNKMIAVSVTKPQVSMTIVENSGKISHLL